MEAHRTLAGEMASTAGEASLSIGTILSATATMQKAIQGILEALQEQRATFTELARNVESIAQASAENAAAVPSVAATVTRLAGVADTLRQSVAGFQV